MKDAYIQGRRIVDLSEETVTQSMPDAEVLSRMTDRQIEKYIDDFARGAADVTYQKICNWVTVRKVRKWIKDELGEE